MDTYFQLCLKCHVMSVRYYVRINVNNDFSAVKQASTILRHTNNRGDLPFPRYFKSITRGEWVGQVPRHPLSMPMGAS